MHLLIYFCGTGDTGASFFSKSQYLNNNQSIHSILVQGTETPEVCDAVIFPNLKKFASRFTRKLFSLYSKDLQLSVETNEDLKNLKIGIDTNHSYLRMV